MMTKNISTNMNRKLIEAAQKGDVHELHNLITYDPLLLRSVALSGGDTPLHVACLGGHVDFVKEVLSLSPELATELNQDGFSPLHVASTNGDVKIVKELLKGGSHVCLVKGKERRVPLHCAVSKGRTGVIHELVTACSDSIGEVTARGENCFHLAVKNNQFEAFNMLFDHVILHHREELLNVKDKRGNSILHLATYTKQYEVICLLLDEKYGLNRKLEVNSLNKTGLTPLDVLTSEGGDFEIEEMLKSAGSLRAEELNSISTPSQVEHSHEMLQNRPRERSKRPSKKLQDFFKYDKIKDSPTKVRNTLLVIAVLIATATYQPVLSPPGGVWQDDFWPSNNSSNNSTSSRSPPAHTAGQAVIGTQNPVSYGLFLLFNSVGFFMSLHMMYFLTDGLPLAFELKVALGALTATYDTCMVAITPGGNVSVFFIIMSIVLPLLMPVLSIVVRDFRKPRTRVETSTAVASP